MNEYLQSAEFFEAMGFIIKDKKGHIVWIYNPEMVRKYSRRSDLRWKPKRKD